ncbi:MAG: hypothetical protein JW709_14050 [Sedimentisphaerales bacterium]|nr:hypothetical protein [Sedimentisphaerales bacterium]
MKLKVQWIVGVSLACCSLAHGQAFYHSDYIYDLLNTLITFETDGSGNPVIVLPGSSELLPANEYADWGFTFNRNIYWVNDGGADFDAAQAIGGSLENAIPSSAVNDFYVIFDTSTIVHSFGFWVVQWTGAATDVTFQIWSASSLLDTIVFTDLAVDGQIGVAEYGFVGYTTNETIRYIRITKSAAILDNFVFSPMSVVLPDPDIDDSGQVNVGDLVLFVEQWLGDDCGRCEGADLNTDGNVDLLDFSFLAAAWLQ